MKKKLVWLVLILILAILAYLFFVVSGISGYVVRNCGRIWGLVFGLVLLIN